MSTKYIVNNITGQTINGQTFVPPYKVYTALLNQQGTDAPVATILQNTLDGEPVWTNLQPGPPQRTPGYYLCTLAGAFTADKTFCSVTYGPNSGVVPLIPLFGNYAVDDEDNLLLQFFNLSSATQDPNNYMANDICVEIRVYN